MENRVSLYTGTKGLCPEYILKNEYHVKKTAYTSQRSIMLYLHASPSVLKLDYNLKWNTQGNTY